MSDVLDINAYSIDFEQDEEGDRGIKELKIKARKRKGRGLDNDSGGYVTAKKRRYNSDASRSTRSGSENWESASGKERRKKLQYRDVDDICPQKSVEGWSLFISGLHEEATEEDIRDRFCDVSPVQSVRTNLDRRTGFLKGYALLEFRMFDDALRAKDKLNGTKLLGCTMKVDWCYLKGPSKVLH